MRVYNGKKIEKIIYFSNKSRLDSQSKFRARKSQPTPQTRPKPSKRNKGKNRF